MSQGSQGSTPHSQNTDSSIQGRADSSMYSYWRSRIVKQERRLLNRKRRDEMRLSIERVSTINPETSEMTATQMGERAMVSDQALGATRPMRAGLMVLAGGK